MVTRKGTHFTGQWVEDKLNGKDFEVLTWEEESSYNGSQYDEEDEEEGEEEQDLEEFHDPNEIEDQQ